MRISTTAHHASRLLAHLAQSSDGQPIPAKELSSQTGISVKFIEKIIRPLQSAGMVRSIRGSAGGHILCLPPESVTLRDVLKVVEGGILPPNCCGKKYCDEKVCGAYGAWSTVTSALEETLNSITLADLMNSKSILRQ